METHPVLLWCICTAEPSVDKHKFKWQSHIQSDWVQPKFSAVLPKWKKPEGRSLLREYLQTLVHQQQCGPEHSLLAEEQKKKHLQQLFMYLTGSKGLPCKIPVLLSLGILPPHMMNNLSLWALWKEVVQLELFLLGSVEGHWPAVCRGQTHMSTR